MEIGGALRLAIPLVAEQLPLRLAARELELNHAQSLRELLAPDPLLHCLALPLLALHADALEVLLRVAQRHLAGHGLLARGLVRVERAETERLELRVDVLAVLVRLDELRLERLDREG